MKRIFFLFLLCNTLVACSEPAQETTAIENAVTEQTGEYIYMMYCAQCHGANGDGQATIQIDRPARSFIDGGFSFGNTVEAIAKTTRSGIPGTPMPPFEELLTDEEVHLVVKHVRQFAPTLKEVLPNEMEMVVGNKPAVVRGMIPPLQDGLELHPRGLLVGNPDGFTYEYRVDDVRLLAIRQGQFVERSDWTGRGGSPLKPLGKIVVLVEDGHPDTSYTLRDGTPLFAKLKSTNVSGNFGVVQYDIVDAEGKKYATVSEMCTPTTGPRTLIEQRLMMDVQRAFQIHLPSSATMEENPQVPVGNQTRTIIHAARERE
jgi:mono/diheme cytochrome c family protein